jgi:GT2 family glycosyltransferase
MSQDPAEPLGRRLSVVLLMFNCAHRILPIIEHLLELDLPIIAVDNGSSDGTADAVSAYTAACPDVEVVRLTHNIGAAGRNAGAERARTPYLLFCDDDGWFEPEGLSAACDYFDRYAELAVINAKILVDAQNHLDPISTEMAASPLPDRAGLPGTVLLSFMAGAVAVRARAFHEVGGYDPRFFIGGEEETLSHKLAKAGWQMRYIPELVMHHYPSLANAGGLRAFGMRNTIVNAWLHRPWRSALRWTAFILADTPKNRSFVRGLVLTARALPWILRERDPMDSMLDGDLRTLDARRFATRRPLLTRRDWQPGDPLLIPKP